MTEASQIESSRRISDDEPLVLTRDDHEISRKAIPESVLKVLYRLQRKGYSAYLCGGSVRDLLLERAPKDFDVVTNARPQELRRLFRNSRIIGRRFRLVHVLFQDTTVEVATFRRDPEPGGEDLLVKSDNTWGSPVEDAFRRDFTINGLFYDISDFTVKDYVGGVADLEAGLIRVIGDPEIRFQEDPVRMLRAIEFASRLDFEIEASTWDAIIAHRDDILRASPARVTDEILELLRRGWSLDSMHLMEETGLLEPLLPELASILKEDRSTYFWRMLEVLDLTTSTGREVPDTLLLSALLFPVIFHGLEELDDESVHLGEIGPLIRERLDPVVDRLVVPAWMRSEMTQNFELVWRFRTPPSERKRDWRLVLRDRASEALALYELYALSSRRNVDAMKAWKALAEKAKNSSSKERNRPRRRRRRRR